jgi:hypothetical protein
VIRTKQLFWWGIAGLILPLPRELHVFAQQKSGSTKTKAAGVSVPFVGCKSDGQAGPGEPPTGSPVPVRLDAKAAKEFAYYSGVGLGVLGPRGWYCFGNYGSSGETLFVSPEPFEIANFFPVGVTGPAIEVSHRNPGTGSGAFRIAEVVARVFPDFEAFAKNVAETLGGPISFGPYPNDNLTYRGNREVVYKTPAQTEGLGTHFSLRKSDSPIEGVAMLVGQPPHLLLLSVRLPPDSRGLTPAIIRQIERDSPWVMH